MENSDFLTLNCGLCMDFYQFLFSYTNILKIKLSSLDFEDISRAEVTGRTEVFFYVNYKMQNLFLPGKERITALPSKSIEINKNKKYVTSTYSELQVDYFYKTNSMEVDFDGCE